MKSDITIHPKDLSATLIFHVEDFRSDSDYKNALAILSMVAGDYQLDPEVEVKELKAFVEQAIEGDKNALEFIVDEEGLELELIVLK